MELRILKKTHPILVPLMWLSSLSELSIITLFYNKDFIGAAIYLPRHFIETLFVVWMAACSQIFAPTGRIRVNGIMMIIFKSISLALVYILTPKKGLYEWLATFLILPHNFSGYIIFTYDPE